MNHFEYQSQPESPKIAICADNPKHRDKTLVRPDHKRGIHQAKGDGPHLRNFTNVSWGTAHQERDPAENNAVAQYNDDQANPEGNKQHHIAFYFAEASRGLSSINFERRK